MNSLDIKELYKNQQFKSIINIYDAESEKKNTELALYAGFSFTKLGLAQKAIECFNFIDEEHFTEQSGKIYRFMGLSNYLLGNYDAALSSFFIGGKKSDAESSLWIRLLFPPLHDLHQTESIIFRFVDDISSFEKKIFIMKNLKALNRISNFIGQNNCCKKIDIYVYMQRTDSIGNTLSYSDNGLKTIHTYINDMNGHEIAHILFNSIYCEMHRNQFIDEGIATFFDQEQTFDEFIQIHKGKFIFFDIKQSWTNSNFIVDNINQYYFAGAFVGFLIHVYGKGKFLEFVKNQSYENAKRIFGLSLDSTIQDFYTIII